MKLMLMDSPPRIQLPRLSTVDVNVRRSRVREEGGFDGSPPLRRKRQQSADEGKAPILRNRKKVFSYETNKDMETYKGHVRAPADAIILFEACRLGLLPRVQRRLSEKERQSIKSGSVFVWDEREAGMRRWTDGKSWSASRVSGSFLTYREMEGKRGGGQSNTFPPPAPPPSASARSNGGRTPESGGGNTSDLDMQQDEGPDGYRYKPDGLMKQSFSITTSSGNHLHLISYYSRSNPAAQQLPNPSNDPSLRHIRPAKGMYPESTVHEHQNIPAVTRSPMASGAPYSAIPQMAGYARHTPHAWPPPPNGQGWQPPHVGPPYAHQQHYGYQYPPHQGSGYYQGGPPPPPPGGQSTQQYSQPTSQAPQQPPLAQSPYEDRRPSHAPHTSQPIDPNLAAYDTRRQQQPPTPEDRQAPPPPPLQHPQEHVYGYGSLDNTSREGPPRETYNPPPPPPPQYDSRGYPPRQSTPHDRRPSSSHHNQPSPSNRSSYPPQPPPHYYNYPPHGPPPPASYGPPHPAQPPYAQHPHYPQHPQHAPPPPQHYQQQQPPPPPPSQYPHQPPPSQAPPYPGPPPSNLQIDPALTSQPSPHASRPTNQATTHSPPSSTVPPLKVENPSNLTTATTNSTYEARSAVANPSSTTIPSIGALMNGSSAEQQNGHRSPSTTTTPNNNNNANATSNGNGNGNSNGNGSSGAATPIPSVGVGGEVARKLTGDRSPANGGGGGTTKDGPQDIATDKVGFSEDQRALKVLNKGFR